MIVFLYLAIYLFPLYGFSVLAVLVLGISLHTFVPALFCIYTIFLIRRVNADTKKYWRGFVTGIALSIIVVTGYCVSWNNNLNAISKNFVQSTAASDHQLPSWARVAQRIPKSNMMEKILKMDIRYAVAQDNIDNLFWSMPTLNFETKVHDPLIMISTFFTKPVEVPQQDRIKILESMYDSRHEAEQRLWSGNDLNTGHVSTNLQLWPALRISYTELIINVSQTPDNTSWSNSEEAIYTFHLPEGGAVTSLSLWIDGKEEKGILTTKSKADSAYKTIVGAERRDPSVVHWKEGNTVTVRVFPVIKGEGRKFKLGITAPLILDQQKLRYDNIYFDGPPVSSTVEDIKINSGDALNIIDIPKGFIRTGNQLFRSKKHYSRTWSIAVSATPLSTDSFNFANHAYRVATLNRRSVNFFPSLVFLDINSSWSTEECTRIYDLVKDKKVYVADGDMNLVELNAGNKYKLFKELRANNFSLFPFYKIDDSVSSLVISKSTPFSPTIDDLRDSPFLNASHKYFNDKRSIRLFNLGSELSPYLKSLKEFRMLGYDSGDESKLMQMLKSNRFNNTIENDNEVAFDGAGISIQRTDVAGQGNAPDHLMRLFAYSHILQQAGSGILADKLDEDSLIGEAEQANVVSPFSSLVVLETQKDYDRFDIASSKNSLKNASSQSKGAVPEPHEWALIILVLLICAALKFRPEFLLTRRR